MNYYAYKMRVPRSHCFSPHMNNRRHPWQLKKIKILGAVLELPPKEPIWPNFEVNELDWQCCVAGSYKTATRIFIFSIVLGAEYSFYVKSIATYAPTFLGCNNSVLAIV